MPCIRYIHLNSGTFFGKSWKVAKVLRPVVINNKFTQKQRVRYNSSRADKKNASKAKISNINKNMPPRDYKFNLEFIDKVLLET